MTTKLNESILDTMLCDLTAVDSGEADLLRAASRLAAELPVLLDAAVSRRALLEDARRCVAKIDIVLAVFDAVERRRS